MSLESAILVILQGFSICSTIEKIDPKISKLLGVQCKNCQKPLSCAGLSGHLLAGGDTELFNHLKNLLANPDVKIINTFMLDTANQQKVACPFCAKYAGWIKLAQKA